jgi:hypothetical protein
MEDIHLLSKHCNVSFKNIYLKSSPGERQQDSHIQDFQYHSIPSFAIALFSTRLPTESRKEPNNSLNLCPLLHPQADLDIIHHDVLAGNIIPGPWTRTRGSLYDNQ